MALADFQSIVDNLVPDPGTLLAAGSRDQAIDLAVLRYSTDRPRPAIEEIAAPGGEFLDLPPGWQVDFSLLTEARNSSGIELCAELDLTLTGVRIRLTLPLVAGAMAEILYTIRHELDAGQDTVPVQDREAVCYWASSVLLEQMATLYAGHKQPTVQADSVDFDNKSRDMAARARRLRDQYLNHLGIDPKKNAASGALVNLDRPHSQWNEQIRRAAARSGQW